jgi:hypothetical protein
MVASSMRYVKRNYWSIHGSSLAAFSCPVNVAGRIHLLSPGPGDRLRNRQDATREKQTRYGQKYAIGATLVGPSGSSAEVVSVWVVRTGEEFPRFLTAYPEGDR